MKTIKFITPKGDVYGITNFLKLYGIQHKDAKEIMKNDVDEFFIKDQKIYKKYGYANYYKGYKNFIEITRQEYYSNAKINDKIRFLLSVKKTTTCWEWIDINKKNEFTFIMRGQSYPSHYASYALHKEKVNRFNLVIQKCNNPKCVNPDHLTIDYKPKNKYQSIVKYYTSHDNYIYLVYEKVNKNYNLIKTCGKNCDLQHNQICMPGQKINL